MHGRQARLRDEIASRDLDAILVTDRTNVRYLSGFTGSYAVLVLTCDAAYLLTDSRYTEQAAHETYGCTVEEIDLGFVAGVADLMARLDAAVIGFEETSLTYAEWRELNESISGAELLPVENLVAKFRMVKDEDEIATIREAAVLADRAFHHVSSTIRPGMTERELALEIDYFMRRNGAEEVAFETIVAEGDRSALPHAKPTDRAIREGEFIIMDFGARCGGYHSDITRTLLLGRADERRQKVYDIVLEAQRLAIAAIRPGLQGWQIDAAARDYISAQGYGEYFGHGLGHGLGLDVHDGRILTRKSEIVLRPGMVVTVEPGIYIPGWGGVRIEDDVLVTDSGCETLTQSPRLLSPSIGGK